MRGGTTGFIVIGKFYSSLGSPQKGTIDQCPDKRKNQATTLPGQKGEII